MIKIVCEKHGTAIRVNLIGENEQEVLENYYSFFNHGATSYDIQWVVPGISCAFWSSTKAFLKAIFNRAMFRVLNAADSQYEHDKAKYGKKAKHKYKGKKLGAYVEAMADAKREIKEIDFTTGYPPTEIFVLQTYSLSKFDSPRDNCFKNF